MKPEKNQKLYLGIDLGGSSIKYGWGSCQQGLLTFHRMELKEPTEAGISKDLVAILEEAEQAVRPNAIGGIGLGTPGTVNRKTGLLTGANPNLPGWSDLDPRRVFPSKWQDRIAVDNDANLMTLAEANLLEGSGYVLGVTIGSGIGCGFVINRKIYHGAQGYAMELGHNTIIADGALCNCGRRGCLEAYASVNGMGNRIREVLPGSQVDDIRQIIDLAKREKKIERIISDSINYLSRAIANLVINLNNEAVVLGGGVVEAAGYPYIRLQRGIIAGLPDHLQKQVFVKKAEFGNKAGVMGGIVLAEHFCKIKE